MLLMAKKEWYRSGLAVLAFGVSLASGFGLQGCSNEDSQKSKAEETYSQSQPQFNYDAKPDLAIKVEFIGTEFHGEVSPANAYIPEGTVRFRMEAIVDGGTPVTLYEGIGVRDENDLKIFYPENLAADLYDTLSAFFNNPESHETLKHAEKIKFKHTVYMVDVNDPNKKIEDPNEKNNVATSSVPLEQLLLLADWGLSELAKRRRQ